MKQKKSWKSELVKEIILISLCALPWFVAVTIITREILFAFIISLVPILILYSYHVFVLKQLPGSRFYKLPEFECQVTVIKKRIFIPTRIADSFSAYFCSEWIIFKTVEGQQIKTYISMKGLDISESPDVGDFVTLHYRKDKRHCYFEFFNKFEQDFKQCRNQ